MKYKKGDEVKVKSLDWYNTNKDSMGFVYCGFHLFDEKMSHFCGQVMTIQSITNLGVISIEGDNHYWTDEMIEGLADEPQEKMVSLDKVCEWLKNTIDDDVLVKCGSVIKCMDVSDFVSYFSKAMEE